MELKKDKTYYQKAQQEEFNDALKKEEFNTFLKKAKIKEEDAKKNIYKIYDSIEELNNCKNCKNLYECKNKVRGHVYFPSKEESNLVFSYIPCKYQKKEQKEVKKTSANILEQARMKDINPTKKRIEVIKWLKDYYDNYSVVKTTKGLYLHGNFGTGKSFLIAALLNELKIKFNINIEIIYVPELLRKLKEDLSLVGDKLYYLENVDILLLDDIGAEKVTEWGRDEILGTIIQTRMNNGMPTFFTSNLNIQELERHLSLTKESEDILKAKRIIERIKYMTDDIELLGNNYRE